MAGVRRNLVIRAGIDLTAFSRGMNRMQKDLEKRAKKLNQLGNKMAMALTVPIMAVIGLGVKRSSDLAESISKVEATFNSSANVIEEWSKTTLKSIGLAQQTALDMAATYGDLGTSLGLTTQEAAKMSMSLVQLAGDLASFKNIKIDVANTALMAIYTGETESLKKLGIVMTQANLNAYALSKGINKTVQEMTQAEQVQLRYNYVMEMTKNAHGDFERTAGGTANKARVLTETFKELTTSLVQGLMPTVNKLLSIGIQVLNWFNNLSPTTKNFITYTLLLVAALGPLVKIYSTLITLKAILVGWYKAATIAKIMHTAAINKETAATMAETAAKNANILTMIKGVALYVAQKVAIVASTVAITAYTIATKLAAAAMWLLNAAFVATPIGWIVLGIGALVTAFVLLWKKLEGFREFWKNLWEGIKNAFVAVVNFLIDGFNMYLKAWKFLINGVISLANKAIKGLNKIPGVNIKLIPKLDENALQIPKLAEGGIAYGNAIVNVGEYSNARTNPEVIAPLDKLQSIIGDREQTININLDGRTVAQIVLDRSGRLIKQIGGV